MIVTYINTLTNKIFKILPLTEECNPYLLDYLDSIHIELVGGLSTFPKLKTIDEYIVLVNTIEYFKNNKLTHKQYKREIFKMIDCIAKLKDIVGDKYD